MEIDGKKWGILSQNRILINFSEKCILITHFLPGFLSYFIYKNAMKFADKGTCDWVNRVNIKVSVPVIN
jgi:hypothetical protein